MGQYTCNNCNVTKVDHVRDEFTVDEQEDTVVCIECGDLATFESIDANAVRKVDAEFDFAMQQYRMKDGTIHPDEDLEGMSPCPTCHGPSNCVKVDAWYEHYQCLECGLSYTGN